jgi:hypothetical protein
MMPSKKYLIAVWVLFMLPGGARAASSRAVVPPPPDSGQAVWKLEHAYWRYVEKNELSDYRKLWHKNFLGWPSVSTMPLRKDQITDWITSHTSKGLTFKTVEFRPAGLQATGDIVVACYWVTYRWLDHDGKGPMHTVRITHAWVKKGKGWQIISGMSMPEAVSCSK